jgi:hypothetical protein
MLSPSRFTYRIMYCFKRILQFVVFIFWFISRDPTSLPHQGPCLQISCNSRHFNLTSYNVPNEIVTFIFIHLFRFLFNLFSHSYYTFSISTSLTLLVGPLPLCSFLRILLFPEDGGSLSLRNVADYLTVYKASLASLHCNNYLTCSISTWLVPYPMVFACTGFTECK